MDKRFAINLYKNYLKSLCSFLRKTGFNINTIPYFGRKTMNKQWKQIGKSMSKNTQNTIQNQWNIEVRGHQNRGQEGSQRGPGRVFGRLERFGSLFLAFWWVLGASCGPKDANLAPTWAPKRTPNRTKIDAKNKAKNRCVLDFHFWFIFWILGRKTRPSWHQNGT